MESCSYLGHVVSNREIRFKVNAFQNQVTKKASEGFLGLTGYYHKFIPGYAKVTAPLTDITKENAPNKPCHDAWN